MADDDDTLTRRRFMGSTAMAAGAVATAAFTVPAVGLAVAPIFERQGVRWQRVAPLADVPRKTFLPVVISLTLDPIGEAAKSTAFVRRRVPGVDREPEDYYNRFIAVSSRCAHVGCPVNYVDAARSFVCPCHGGVYDFRGVRVGGPPPRPLDRFLTRVRRGWLELGPRYSVDSRLRRYSPRDPGEGLDGIGRYLYPARPTTERLP
jgi:menaquinol-cytochrome c reductase iron-sulfur subunit